jgi:DNA polymerase-3 subunit gamma/tau
MSYQVIARKWRPQKFEDVVFQDHVSRTLQNSIRSGRISHAYLFSGPRGVGKTTMARILAKALNCQEGPTATPCGVCENCLEIKKGSSFDVIEIDGASNNGVDDIRELRENVNFAPVKSKYKVYIIDEVHMVTTQAFNALLKTLEEPPRHIVFIFATTEYHKIPETILSRCQKFFFKKIPIQAIVEHLKHIALKENFNISDNALYPIARAADGAMRDAQSLLDQVISFSEKDGGPGAAVEIGESQALTILGIVPLESYMRHLNSVAEGDALAIFGEIERVISMGVDIPRYVTGFIDVIRSLRLVRNGIALQPILGLSDEEMRLFRDTAQKFSDEEISRMFRVVMDLQSDLRYSSNERVNLEMALLDMLRIHQSPSLASILKKMEEKEKGGGASSPAPDADAVKKKPPESLRTPEPAEKGLSLAIDPVWKRFMASIAKDKQFIHNLLSQASARLEGGTVFIEYPAGDEHMYQTRMFDSERRSFITAELSRLMGQSVRIDISQKRGAPGNRAAASSAEAPGKAVVKAAGTGGSPVSKPVEKDPEPPAAGSSNQTDSTIEKLKDVFHGQIIEEGE